jgi:SAM-dependent methyltransferase
VDEITLTSPLDGRAGRPEIRTGANETGAGGGAGPFLARFCFLVPLPLLLLLPSLLLLLSPSLLLLGVFVRFVPLPDISNFLRDFPLASQQMEVWHVLLILFLLAALNYVNLVLEENIFKHLRQQTIEGFADTNESEIAGAVSESSGIIKYLDNDDLYDKFYASVYDQLTQGSVRTQAEVGLMLQQWTKRGDAAIESMEVLDAGCGTGIAVASLAKMGVKKVVGLDKSEAMLNQATSNTIPQTTLTEDQKKVISWRKDELLNPSACQGGEFTHVFLLYFTVYYLNDKETLFRNLHFWTKPGGRLVVHVVNKHKFDPMLESASPWLGFSLQKYTESRITKSEVVFNKFTYTGEFDLQDPGAEFRESFRFKDSGLVRRQRHAFVMEDMERIVGFARAAGWTYLGFTDLTPISFEYAYHLHFRRS